MTVQEAAKAKLRQFALNRFSYEIELLTRKLQKEMERIDKLGAIKASGSQRRAGR